VTGRGTVIARFFAPAEAPGSRSGRTARGVFARWPRSSVDDADVTPTWDEAGRREHRGDSPASGDARRGGGLRLRLREAEGASRVSERREGWVGRMVIGGRAADRW